MRCQNCKRSSKLSKWESRNICGVCKGQYYRKIDKIYQSVLNLEKIEIEKTVQTIWDNFVKTCDGRTAIANIYECCERNQFGVISCSKCAFRCLFFSMPPPKLKLAKKSQKQTENYLKFKSMWRRITSGLESLYFDTFKGTSDP